MGKRVLRFPSAKAMRKAQQETCKKAKEALKSDGLAPTVIAEKTLEEERELLFRKK